MAIVDVDSGSLQPKSFALDWGHKTSLFCFKNYCIMPYLYVNFGSFINCLLLGYKTIKFVIDACFHAVIIFSCHQRYVNNKNNNTNMHIYRAPYTPTEGADELSVRPSGESYWFFMKTAKKKLLILHVSVQVCLCLLAMCRQQSIRFGIYHSTLDLLTLKVCSSFMLIFVHTLHCRSIRKRYLNYVIR